MSLGLALDKNIIDSRVGNLIWQTRRDLDDILLVQAQIAAMTDASLIALGYTQAEVTQLKADLLALTDFVKVGRGQKAQTPANNFFFGTEKYTGLQ